MQIKKTYKEVNPELLYHEIRDFTLKQVAVIDEAMIRSYAVFVNKNNVEINEVT